MSWATIRGMSVAPLGLGVLLLLGTQAKGVQAPGAPPASKPEPVPERTNTPGGAWEQLRPVAQRVGFHGIAGNERSDTRCCQ
jgi:hypothetical protein